MRLTYLGTSGSYSAPGRPGAGLLIEQAGTRVWCDAGPGTFDALERTLDLDLLSAIVVSHQHADHCSDLLAAYQSFAHRPPGLRGIPLYAPAAVAERVLAFLGKEDFRGVFDFRPVTDGDTIVIGDIEVAFAVADHPVPTVASRWTDGARVLAYSADTGPGGEWDRVAADAHLFVCEATFQEGSALPHHLSAAQAGSIARERGARVLALTHIPPHLDASVSVGEAEATFGRPVGLAVPGVRTKV